MCTGHGLTGTDNWGFQKMIFTGLTQPFWVDMSIGLWAGVFGASRTELLSLLGAVRLPDDQAIADSD